MRPKSVVLFDWLYLTSIILGALNSAISIDKLNAILQTNASVQAIGMGAGSIMAMIVLGLVVGLVIWFYAARRASVVAKWLFVAVLAYGLFNLPKALAEADLVSTTGPAGTLVLTLLQVAAAIFLFQRDSRAWFARKGSADSH